MEQYASSAPEGDPSGLLTLLDTMGALMFTKDRCHRYTYANQSFSALVGLAARDVQGKRATDLFDPATAGALEASDRKVFETGQTSEQRELHVKRDGAEQHRFLTLKTPIFDTQGEVLGLTGVGIDITDGERTEMLLRDSCKLLEAAISCSEGHIYVKGPDRRYLYVSLHVAATFQRPVSEIIGRTDAELFPGGDSPFAALDDKVYSTGRRHVGEEAYPDGQGRLRHYWSIKRTARMGGQENCLIGVSTDITELREAEREVARSEARFRVLFEDSVEALIVFNTRHVLDCNGAALKMLGVPNREAARGLDVKDLSPLQQPSGDASVSLMKAYLEVVRQKGRHRFEWMLRRCDDGVELPAEITVSAIERDGEPVMLATIRDLTERKAYEETIHKLAFYDALTNLPNRRLFFDRLSQALAQSERSALYGAVIYLDLDNFKPLNDQHGHLAGDLLLLEVGRRLRNCIREQDTAARLGGDEFAILLVQVGDNLESAMHQTMMVGERILHDLSRPYVLRLDERGTPCQQIEHTCSASLGLALFPPCESDAETVVRRADDAMYRSKAEGRNRICFADVD